MLTPVKALRKGAQHLRDAIQNRAALVIWRGKDIERLYAGVGVGYYQVKV